MIRLVTAFLLMLALFCAPVAMHIAGIAMAAPATTKMDQGCEGMGHHSPDKQKPGSGISCAVACAAIPALPAALPTEAFHDETHPFTGPISHLIGIGPEAELPPPRPARRSEQYDYDQILGVIR